jgi:hypothetical protein
MESESSARSEKEMSEASGKSSHHSHEKETTPRESPKPKKTTPRPQIVETSKGHDDEKKSPEPDTTSKTGEESRREKDSEEPRSDEKESLKVMDFGAVLDEKEEKKEKKKPYVQKINHRGVYEALLSLTEIAAKGLAKRNPGKSFLKFVKKAGEHKNFEKIIDQFVTYFLKIFRENQKLILEGESDVWIKKIKFGIDTEKYLSLGDIYSRSTDDKKDEIFFLMYEVFCHIGLTEEQFRKVEEIRAEEFEDEEDSPKPKAKGKGKKNPLADLMGSIFDSIKKTVEDDKPMEQQFTGEKIGKVVTEVFNNPHTLASVQDFGKSLAGSELGGMLKGLEPEGLAAQALGVQKSGMGSPLDLLSQPLEVSARKTDEKEKKEEKKSARKKKEKEDDD